MSSDTESTRIPEGMSLPNRLSDINPEFLTQLLQARGLLEPDNAVASVEEAGVGMTAGYFSDIKKIHCQFSNTTDCPAHFVAKAWPDFEMLPEDAIGDMFIKDIKGYMFPSERFYPRPRVFLADFDLDGNRYGLIMEDVDQFADQKVHESERVGCYADGVVYAMLPSCYPPRVAGDESEVNARSSEDTVAIFATSSTHSANRRRARRSDGGGIAPNHASGER